MEIGSMTITKQEWKVVGGWLVGDGGLELYNLSTGSCRNSIQVELQVGPKCGNKRIFPQSSLHPPPPRTPLGLGGK